MGFSVSPDWASSEEIAAVVMLSNVPSLVIALLFSVSFLVVYSLFFLLGMLILYLK